MIIYWKRLYEDLIVLYYIDCMMFYMLLYYCTLKKKKKKKKKLINRCDRWWEKLLSCGQGEVVPS